MKTKLVSAVMFALFAIPASAQVFNPYRLDFMKPACEQKFNPYTGETSTVCAMPEIENPHSVYSIVQASIGKTDKEIAFVVLLNLTDENNFVVVEYTIAGKPGTFFQHINLRPKERFAIGLHEDPLMVGEWNFSVVTKFEKSGDVEMVWHSGATLDETATKTGKRVN